MHGWQARLAAKQTDAAGAIAKIAPGRRILIGSGAAEPKRLVEALVQHGAHLRDNEIVHILTLGPAPYVAPEMAGRFRHTAFFIGANVRAAVQEGRADFMPVFLSEIPELLRSRRVPIDVAMVQVSPPDAHGFCSLGVAVDVVRAAVQSAELVIAELNPRMPRTHGDSFVHVDELDACVRVDDELPELPCEEPDAVSRQIAEHVARLVPDGATIQTGIGSIPDAVTTALMGHRDLGIHTEMFSDGLMRLMEAGVANGSRKTLLPGKAVTSFLMGTRALYDWAHDNPALEMRPSEFTNDPLRIAQNERMISINGALAVDLTGQVAADTLAGKFFSGIGGQVDFVRGASRSRGGKSIIAIPSTAKSGKLSRIVAAFEEGAGVVTSRGDVRYVVTEWGVADLFGKNIRQRALALIEVAHPDFRAELLEGAKRRHYVFLDQVAPKLARPWLEERRIELADGTPVAIRPARLSDESALQDLFYSLTHGSVYRRYRGRAASWSHAEVQRLVDVDERSSYALVAAVPPEAPNQLVALAHFELETGSSLADLAFVVLEGWQSRGLGAEMMRAMCRIARERGLEGFRADVLQLDKPMLTVFHRLGLAVSSRREAEGYHLELRFGEGPVDELRDETRIEAAPLSE
ncbi:MAG: 4-hydroxybutyrate coenzyme A transferase [Planctomycetes bacterium]|nr:4-hydroxybutyrate coenzyme A transferase [Planctomycetota bacterium]